MARWTRDCCATAIRILTCTRRCSSLSVSSPCSQPSARQRSIAASALRDEPFVFYAKSAGTIAWDKPLSLCGEAGFRPRVVQEASNWVSILQLIAVGFGVSIAPECVRSVATEGVVCLPLRGVTEVSHVELAFRRGETRPIVQSFAQIARTVAGER